jgi:hypothetical protein
MPRRSNALRRICGALAFVGVVLDATRGASAEEPETSAQARVVIGEAWRHGAKAGPIATSTMGALVAAPPAMEGHPLPRVVVDVVRKPAKKTKRGRTIANDGALDGAIEASLRRAAWTKTIACYRKGALKNQALEGETLLAARAKSGRLEALTVAKAMPDPAVSKCLAKSYAGMAVPVGKRARSVAVRVRIFPGDDPIAPTAAEIDPVSGSVDPGLVADALRAELPRVEACYATARTWAPELAGTLAIRLRIEPSGQVSEAFEEGGPFAEERLARCVLRHVRTLRTAAPTGGPARVVVPIAFEPPSPPTEVRAPEVPTPDARPSATSATLQGAAQ